MNAYDQLDRARRDVGWTIDALWVAYVGLGGTCSLDDVVHHLAESSGFTARQYDYMAQALNDQFVTAGGDHPVPYSEMFDLGTFDAD